VTDTLKIFAYNVGFGDGILLAVPDGGTTRWVLIDVGNVLRSHGGADDLLVAAVRDIHARTGGHVDLYIMTHEHLDHVQGLLAAKNEGIAITADHVWMTASAGPHYYDANPEARKKKLGLERAVAALRTTLSGSQVTAPLAAMLELNNSARTLDCVDHLRTIGPTHYLHRASSLDGIHPFTETTVRILAPEEDTSVYYGAVRAQLDAANGAASPARREPAARLVPSPGVDAGAFYDLMEQMDRGFAGSVFQIDAAANNTSLVVELRWRGRRLLFVGDAEQASWRQMAAQPDLLQPLDFLKIGHHGSRNATPPDSVLDLCLPRDRREQAIALVSTCADVYESVPDDHTLARIASRVKVIHSTAESTPVGSPLVIEVPPGG
jgi:beta-lactamase superfamily II metal-dependent hydrolase